MPCRGARLAASPRSRRLRLPPPRGPPALSAACLSAARRAAGFAQVLAPRAFSFPADHGAHREFRQEWWYTTGQLDAADGERFGFELTFFRYALAPARLRRRLPARPRGAAKRSTWRTSR